MASSFFDLLTQNQPSVKTNQALLLLGLQNDFVKPEGRLPVSSDPEFVERIRRLVPIFRENAGDVIWVRTEYLEDRRVNDPSGDGDLVLVDADRLDSTDGDSEDDIVKALPQIAAAKGKSNRHGRRALDLLKRVSARKRPVRAPSPLVAAPPPPEEEEELFLSRASPKGPACVPSTPGWEFAAEIQPNIDTETDPLLSTSHYSAFNSTKLLAMLRAKLITELYVVGCLTNVSIYATALDAARHGVSICLLEDCLAYRKLSRHEEALKQMSEMMGAQVTTSKDIIDQLVSPSNQDPKQESSSAADDAAGLHHIIKSLTINERSASKSADTRAAKASTSNAHKSADRNPKNGKTIAADNTATAEVGKDSRPGSSAASGQAPPSTTRSSRRSHDSTADSQQNFVKTKVRMRQRTKNDSKTSTEKPDRTKKSNSKTQDKPTETSSKEPPTTESPPRSALAPKTPSSKPNEESKEQGDSSARKGHSLKPANSQPSLSISPDKDSKSSSFARPKSLDVLSKSKSNPNLDASDKSARPSSLSAMSKKHPSLATFPTLGPSDTIGEGDSRIIHDFFPESFGHKIRSDKPLKDDIFQKLYNEVHWQKMLHVQGEVPRLVCVQGEFGKDGSMPVYRHPSDQSLPLLHFSPAVQLVREQVEKLIKHPVNHVLIQLYRSGNDYISEHSDKTLDIVRGSSIANVSFGAQRTMRLRTKRSAKDHQETEESLQRNTQRVHMPHNSMFVLGQDTNMRWLHGINPDKRRNEERSDAEKAYSGMRISLTFRQIGTYLDSDSRTIWGQGATSKDRANANTVINGDEDETDNLILAFAKENQNSEFDWKKVYGAGFDVHHFKSPSPDRPIFFRSTNSVESRQVALCLAELGLDHAVCEAPGLVTDYEHNRQVCFRDIDTNHTEVAGALPILLYLDRYHQLDRSDAGKAVSATSYIILLKIEELKRSWADRNTAVRSFLEVMAEIEDMVTIHKGDFIAGARFSIADCAAWPVLDAVFEGSKECSRKDYPTLAAYYERIWTKRKQFGKLRKTLPELR